MDYQFIWNIVLTLGGALGGWILNNLKSSIEDLHKRDMMLADKVQAIEVLVAGTYVKRDDLEKMAEAIFAKLDKIETKLDHKADKLQ